MRLPKIIIPLLVLIALFAGYALRAGFTQPTTTEVFAEGEGATAKFVVQGVRCKGTAMFFSSLYSEVPGIFGIETFATERTAVFNYDPKTITPERIREIMEAPIAFDDGTTQQVFKCVSVQR
jgi:hypothetical protein